jgi:putative transcriptional regulator
VGSSINIVEQILPLRPQASGRDFIDNGLTLKIENSDYLERSKAPKITKFNPECQYIFELALHSARLKQRKYIETEHLLLGLIQLIQLGNSDLSDLLQEYEVDVDSLIKGLTEVI